MIVVREKEVCGEIGTCHLCRSCKNIVLFSSIVLDYPFIPDNEPSERGDCDTTDALYVPPHDGPPSHPEPITVIASNILRSSVASLLSLSAVSSCLSFQLHPAAAFPFIADLSLVSSVAVKGRNGWLSHRSVCALLLASAIGYRVFPSHCYRSTQFVVHLVRVITKPRSCQTHLIWRTSLRLVSCGLCKRGASRNQRKRHAV